MAEKANRINFTKAAIEAIEPPAKLAYWYDTRQSGLLLMVTPKGSKTFYVYRKVEGRPERIKLGQWPAMPVDLARKKAAETLGRIAAGENPAQERRGLAADPTFAEVFAWWVEHYAKAHDRQTWKQDQANFNRYLADLGRKRVSAITRADVRALHTKLKPSGIYTANRALWLVRKVWNKALSHDVIVVPNPAIGIQAYRETARDRRLSRAEADRFILALLDDHDDQARDFFLLGLFTGARRANLQAMRWDQIDFEAATWRIPQTKNGTPQTVPLLDYELALLRERREAVTGPWVFPGSGRSGHMVEPKRAWSRIITAAGLEDFRIHDLRRQLASLAVDAGATGEVVSKMLHHRDYRATAIYARLALDPVREAKARALAPVFATMREMTGEA